MTARNHTRRGFLKAAGLVAGAAAAGRPLWAQGAAGAGKAAPPAPGARPNVLLAIADDLTFDDIGCYGSPNARTPNMDRLAAEGMRFTRAFTATAMCAPTRQQLYTGLFPIRNGAYPNHSKVHGGTKSLVHHLKALGYRVGLCGKTHFGPPDSFPFEMVQEKGIEAFLVRDPKQPFCLIFASHHPHLPWSAGDAGDYDPAKLVLHPYMVDTPEFRRELPAYYAEATAFDSQVGQCMELVRKAGCEQDTIFLCTSEQGGPFPHGKWTCYEGGLHVALIARWPRRVKPGSTTDAMVQYVDVTPTLVEAAGGDAGAIDTGRPDADGRTGFDGRSFLNVLLGKADRHAEHVFGAHTTRGIIAGSECYPIRSIRNDTHKYIRNLNHAEPFQNVINAGGGKGWWASWVEKAKTDDAARRIVEGYARRPAEELYDLRADPHEMHNLADDPKLADVKADLRKRLEAWMKQQGDLGNETERKGKDRQGRGGGEDGEDQAPGQTEGAQKAAGKKAAGKKAKKAE